MMYDLSMDTVEAQTISPLRDDVITISLSAEQWDALLGRPYADNGLLFAAKTAIAEQVPGWEARALSSDSCAWLPGRSIWAEALSRLRNSELADLNLGPYRLHANETPNLIVIDINSELHPEGIDIPTSRLLIELASKLRGYTTAWNGYGEDTMTLSFEGDHGPI